MGTGKLFWDTWQNTEGTIGNRLLFRLGEYSDTHVSFTLWIVGYTPTVWQHGSFSTYTILHFTPSAESKRVFHFFLGAKNSRENCRTRSRTYKACRWEQQAEDGEADNSKWTCCWQRDFHCDMLENEQSIYGFHLKFQCTVQSRRLWRDADYEES